MTCEIVTFSGQSAVVGLNWDAQFLSAGAGKVRDIRSREVDRQRPMKRLSVKLRNQVGIATGSITVPQEQRTWEGRVAAAAAASHGITGNAIYIEPVDGPGGLYWLGVVQNGLPNPFSDQIGNEEEILERAALIQEALPNTPVFPPGRLGSIIKSLKPREANQYALRNAQSNIVPRTAAALFIVATVIVAWILFLDDSDSEQRSKARREAAAKKSYAALQTTTETEMKQLALLRGRLASETPAVSYTNWFAALKEEPLTVVGWRVKNLTCEKDNCRITYERLKGNVVDLQAIKPDATGDWKNLGEAQIRVSSRVRSKEDPLANVAIYTGAMNAALIATAQSLEDNKVALKIDPPIAGGKFMYGTWTAQGERWASVQLLLDKLAALPLQHSMVLDQFNVNLANGRAIGWSMRGQYVFYQEKAHS